MDKIKGFFEEKKMDSKFKKAGGGQRLDSGSSSSSSAASSAAAGRSAGASAAPAQPRPANRATSAAACAAATRQQQLQARTGAKVTGKVFSKQTSDSGAQQRQGQAAAAAAPSPSLERQRSSEAPAAESRLFPVRLVCPVCSNSYARSGIQEHFTQCLPRGLSREALTTSACMVRTLTQDKDRAQVCVSTICKYLDNAIAHPTEEKFARVRLSNKAFQDRVASCPGAKDFFLAVGFEIRLLGEQGAEEEFLVLKEGVRADTERLEMCKELLTSTEPLKATLDRCLQVFHMSAAATSFALPASFFRLSTEEVKREQQRLKQEAELATQLRTKTMRERDAAVGLRNYRYCVVRVRLPDTLVLQATFYPLETLAKVRHVVHGALRQELEAYPFTLIDPSGRVISDDSITLSAAKWVPHALISLRFDGAPSSITSANVLRASLLQDVMSL